MEQATLKNIQEYYGFELTIHRTGGGCESHYHELNTNQTYMLISNEVALLTSDFKQDITIGIYHADNTLIDNFFAGDLNELRRILEHIFALWGY